MFIFIVTDRKYLPSYSGAFTIYYIGNLELKNLFSAGHIALTVHKYMRGYRQSHKSKALFKYLFLCPVRRLTNYSLPQVYSFWASLNPV